MTRLEIGRLENQKWAEGEFRKIDFSKDTALQLTEMIQNEEERRNALLFADQAALQANTQQQLDETRDYHWNTYKKMAEAPEMYSASTRAHFRQIAVEASAAAKGIETYREKLAKTMALVNTMSQHFVALAQLGGESFEQLGRDIGSFFTNLDTGLKMFDQTIESSQKRQSAFIATWGEENLVPGTFAPDKVRNFGIASALFDKNATSAQKWGSAVASGAAIATGAMQTWTAVTQAASAEEAVFSGAMSGAQAGAAFGPWGAAIGAAAGAVTGFIASLTAGRRAVKDFAASFDTAAAGTGFDELHKEMLRLGAAGEAMWIDLTQKTGRGDVEEAKRKIKEIQDALAALDADIQKYNLGWADTVQAQEAASQGRRRSRRDV